MFKMLLPIRESILYMKFKYRFKNLFFFSFGAFYAGTTTGIIYNNEMDDFSVPGTVNMFGVPASPANFIQPFKKPMSSMSPIIVLDENDDVRLAMGAAGGTHIITSVAEVNE